MHRRALRWLVMIASLALVAAACGNDNGAAPTTTVAPGEASALEEACGDRVVVQTDWFPEPEHGSLYQLAGVEGEVDKERGRYSGEIAGTGVILEIRSGGPFTGFQQVTAQLYTNPEILLGYVSTDEAVQNYQRQPVMAVMAPLNKNPQILMWSAEEYDFETFEDIGESGARVRFFEGAVYVPYMVGKGWLNERQLDGSYDGSPAQFIAEGNLVQQGFATNEPYKYENDFEEWGGKPIDYLLIHDSGLELYSQSLSIKADQLEDKAACLELLVPLLQQAQVDYIRNPDAVNARLLEIVEELDTFWTLSEVGNDFAVEQMLDLDIVSNGHDSTLGNFDQTRVQRVIDDLIEVFLADRVDVDEDLKAEDITTNQFIDPSIGL